MPHTSDTIDPNHLRCRFCGTELRHELINLGAAPPTNAYLDAAELTRPELYFPLQVLVCHECWLVQTADIVEREKLFSKDYAYFSSCSTSWVDHARRYVDGVVKRFNLTPQHLVVEVAANDGYLLQHFAPHRIPCFGIEPTTSTAEAARTKGITIYEEFFGRATAKRIVRERGQADLMIGNNVLAHVPDINDFVAGFAEMLKPDGVATFEFPSLQKLIENNYFDSIYHEHFSYLSLTALLNVLPANGLDIFDVEMLPTHGGSLRLYTQRVDTRARKTTDAVKEMQRSEEACGMRDLEFYRNVQRLADSVKYELLEFLIRCKREGKRVVAYGAAAKGNTLFNYAGIKPDLLPCVYDASPLEEGRFLPGSRVPILSTAQFRETTPDYVILTPWNLFDEIISMYPHIEAAGGKWVTTVPRLTIHPPRK